MVNKDFKVNGLKNNVCFISDWIRYTAYNVPYIDITYTAGYSEVPFDLKQAHIDLTALILSKES
jgi:hypothetical protein